MKSTSGSMSRSMSLSRTVSSDRSMSIEDVLRRRNQNNGKYSSPSKDEHKTSSSDKESRHRRSYSRSSRGRRSSSSSESYDKYKKYKNFRKGKYSRSVSSSRSYNRRRSRSSSYSYTSTSSSRRSSLDSKSSVSRSRSRTPRRVRRRNELHRSPVRRPIRDRRSSRGSGPRVQEKRNLVRRPLRNRPRLEDKFTFEDEPRLNGRNRMNERLNGFRKGTNRESRKEFKVDRKYNTPFLLKVFASGVSEDTEQSSEPEELHVYAWLDTTLRDLVNLIKDISPPTRNRSNTWTFSSNKGENSIELGNVHCFKPNAREDNRTLESLKFQIGSSLKLTFKD